MNRNHTKGKIYAVDYAGHWNIQDGEMYGDKNILDAESVGKDTAEANAERLAKCWNMHDELLQFAKEMSRRYPNSPWIYKEANELIEKANK